VVSGWPETTAFQLRLSALAREHIYAAETRGLSIVGAALGAMPASSALPLQATKSRASGYGKALGAGQGARFGRAQPCRGRLGRPLLVASRWALSRARGCTVYQSNIVLSDSVRPLAADR
jgi:hypothetical protein